LPAAGRDRPVWSGKATMSEDREKNGISASVTAGDDCRRSIEIEVPPERFLAEKEKALEEITRSVTIPGFRKGKAPRDAVLRRYADEVHQEAIKSVLPGAYAQAVAEHQLQPIGDPVFRDVRATENEPLRFTVEIEVEPVLEISSYKGIEIAKREPTVEDEEVERVLESIREREVTYEPVERGAVIDDVVVLDYVPIGEDGAPDEQRRVTGYPVQLGAGQLFPVFEEAVTGLSAGETGRASIDYPEDYQPEHLAGKRIEYVFTVKEVREKRLPSLDDALAVKVDEKFATLDALRTDIRERLREEKEREDRRRREEEAIDRILDSNPFDIPATMIERYRAELYKEEERRRQSAGAPPEQDEQRKKEIDELFDRIARRNIRRFFLIDRIAELEKIAVTEEDLKREIDRIAAGSGRPAEEAEAFFAPGSEHRRNLRGRIRERKVMEVILGEGEKDNG